MVFNSFSRRNRLSASKRHITSNCAFYEDRVFIRFGNHNPSNCLSMLRRVASCLATRLIRKTSCWAFSYAMPSSLPVFLRLIWRFSSAISFTFSMFSPLFDMEWCWNDAHALLLYDHFLKSLYQSYPRVFDKTDSLKAFFDICLRNFVSNTNFQTNLLHKKTHIRIGQTVKCWLMQRDAREILMMYWR